MDNASNFAPSSVSTRIRGYRCRFVWSEEDEAFVGTVDELPGCSAVGGNWTEAADELVIAIEAWIGAAKAAGNPIPLPEGRAHG